MRHILIASTGALLLFLLCLFTLSWQLWHSAMERSYAGARASASRIERILDEAEQATQVAIPLFSETCTERAQVALGSEAARQPHLRSVVMLKNGDVWCSSLPGNKTLLRNPRNITDSGLSILEGGEMLDGSPVLAYITKEQEGLIFVSISNVHVRDSLLSTDGVAPSLAVWDLVMGREGRVAVFPGRGGGRVWYQSERYPFRLVSPEVTFFSISRMLSQGGGLLVMAFFISFFFGLFFRRYLKNSASLTERLRQAVRNNEIIPFYQPVVSSKTGEICGLEVLARWHPGTPECISPDVFIQLAEKNNLIIPLTQGLMSQVVSDINSIDKYLPEKMHLGINISMQHIASDAFLRDFCAFQQSFGDKIKVVIEITEREPLLLTTAMREKLQHLSASGTELALDDFGTGYSALSNLNELHVDYIKLDKSFVQRITGAPESTLLIDCVIHLARKLSLSIIAEGVETDYQMKYLSEQDIPFLQGYYFWEPVRFTEIKNVLMTANPDVTVPRQGCVALIMKSQQK